MRMLVVVRRLAAWSITAMAPAAVFAQPIIPPAPELTNVATDQNTLRFDAGANLEHHSNVAGLASGVDPQATYGHSKRSDTILRGGFGVSYDQLFSLQRLTMEARLDPTKYFTYSQFDYLGYSGRINLDWAVGNALYGTLGVRAAQALTSVLANQSFVNSNAGSGSSSGRNLERRNTLYGSAGLRLSPSWSLFVGADTTKLTNSAEYYKPADNTLDGYEAGVRYAPGTGTEVSLLGRHAKGDYKNNQVVDASGNTLATSLNNSFKQNAALVRMAVQPSEDTRITGEAGYVKRSYNTNSERDYTGPTALLTLAWRPAGAFYMNVELARDIASALYLSNNYIQVTELRLAPVFVLTGKLRLNGRFIYSQQEYKGDTGVSTSSAGTRKDNVYTYGLQLAYEYSRGLAFTADLRRLSRTSNSGNFGLTDNIVGMGVLARF